MNPPSTPEEVARTHAALVHQLGGAACVVPVPSAFDLRAFEVGLLGVLPCWSMHASVSDARDLARRLSRRGALGLILADDTRSGMRAVVCTMPPTRFAIIGPDCRSEPVLVRLQQVLAAATLIEAALAASRAIDIDSDGRRAFRRLRRALDGLASALPDQISIEERHAWALLQVTRLLFLRFVESEGWLDGRPDFLRRAADECLASGRDPARHLLEPLFFGTLNTPMEQRTRLARSLGSIPYLNGGLFEPHPLERRRRWTIPRSAWFEPFSLLLDGIEVSLDSRANQGEVTPEMLGRVFEGAMDPVERAGAGTFYTPPQLVHALLTEAFACHLAPRLKRKRQILISQLSDPDPELRMALGELRLLDPAVGSGAFLVGALRLMHGPGAPGARRIRHLITRRLFGVDRNPAAVRLAELRLWLDLLRAMRGRPVGKVTPLPNLDVSMRAGDALLDPLAGARLPADETMELRRVRATTRELHGAARRTALAGIRRAELQALSTHLRQQLAVLEAERRDIESAAQERSLFGERSQLDSSSRKRLGELAQQEDELRRHKTDLALGSMAGGFAVEVAFPAQMTRGGFDMVVGNPPWVRAERLPRDTRDRLSQRYRWWHSAGSGWRHAPDLSVAFIERGLGLLRDGGTLAYLVPTKLATAAYAERCRAELATRTSLQCVADLANDPRAGFEATVYPLALVTRRAVPAPGQKIIARLGGGPVVSQRLWQRSGTWSSVAPALQEMMLRLNSDHPALLQQCTPSLGVKTGCNKAFLDPPAQLHRWCRPLVRGRDIAGDGTRPGGMILWPADSFGTPWETLPREVAEYLEAFRHELMARTDLQRGPWWQLFRTSAASATHRVIWSDMARDLRAVIPSSDTVPLNSCYLVPLTRRLRALALTAWLNSAVIRVISHARAEPAANGYRRFAARAVGSVPLPEGILDCTALHSLAVSGSPADINEWVEGALGMTPSERDLVHATNRG